MNIAWGLMQVFTLMSSSTCACMKPACSMNLRVCLFACTGLGSDLALVCERTSCIGCTECVASGGLGVHEILTAGASSSLQVQYGIGKSYRRKRKGRQQRCLRIVARACTPPVAVRCWVASSEALEVTTTVLSWI